MLQLEGEGPCWTTRPSALAVEMVLVCGDGWPVAVKFSEAQLGPSSTPCGTVERDVGQPELPPQTPAQKTKEVDNQIGIQKVTYPLRKSIMGKFGPYQVFAPGHWVG